MASPELLEWVQQVVAETEANKIKWKTQNPTTFIWDIAGPPAARVVLQRLQRNQVVPVGGGRNTIRSASAYILSAFQQPPQPIQPPFQPTGVTMNGQEDDEVNAPLEKLYKVVTGAVVGENLDFLRSLLPK
jgi:hypothetical protein